MNKRIAMILAAVLTAIVAGPATAKPARIAKTTAAGSAMHSTCISLCVKLTFSQLPAKAKPVELAHKKTVLNHAKAAPKRRLQSVRCWSCIRIVVPQNVWSIIRNGEPTAPLPPDLRDKQPPIDDFLDGQEGNGAIACTLPSGQRVWIPVGASCEVELDFSHGVNQPADDGGQQSQPADSSPPPSDGGDAAPDNGSSDGGDPCMDALIWGYDLPDGC